MINALRRISYINVGFEILQSYLEPHESTNSLSDMLSKVSSTIFFERGSKAQVLKQATAVIGDDEEKAQAAAAAPSALMGESGAGKVCYFIAFAS